MKTVVLMAYRGDGEGYGGSGARDRAFTFVWDYLTSFMPSEDIISYDSGDEPFSISRSYNMASEIAGDWDKAVIHPPDVFAPWQQIEKAVEMADDKGAVWVYDHIVKMSKEQTQEFFKGNRDFKAKRYKWGFPPFVVNRHVWDTVGGFLEGMKGYGGEDGIFKHCSEVFCGPQRRVPGIMLTFYHPRDATDHDKDFYARQEENEALRNQIWAIKEPRALRRFLNGL